MTSVLKLGVTPSELGELLRVYVDAIPESVISVIGARVDLAGPEGSLRPLGVVAGVVFAMLPRPSYSARLSWFRSLDWRRVSRMLFGLRLTPPGAESPSETAPGFKKVVGPAAFDAQYALLPPQPGNKSRVWGVDSFAQLPEPGGKVRRGIA